VRTPFSAGLRIALCPALLCLGAIGQAQVGELHAPAGAVAGNAVTLQTTGAGSATFYLSGPSVALKREVKLGEGIELPAAELQQAGMYLGVVCTDTCSSIPFYVAPAKPASVTFLVHPSRAPVALNDVISGVALPFDEFRNLVVTPAPVSFELVAGGKSLFSHTSSTQNGVAWFRTGSTKSAGPLEVRASLLSVSAKRVVQQVASDPCGLRIKGQRSAKGIVVETEPVRDCAGNPVPDGTVVTFTAHDGKETSTVDAPIKQGVARAQITATGPVVISAASGVVMGNELRMGAQ
jgi:hypothetical protein